MSIIGSGHALLLASAAPAAAVTGVSRSLRFNGNADSAYLNRTPSSASNRTTWTWSGWAKRSNIAPPGYQSLFTATTAGNETLLYFDTSNRLRFYNYSGSTLADKVTTAVFRDPSAWYHIVLTWDTTNATAADRVRIYVNGVRQTAFDASTDAGSSEQSTINNTIAHMLGSYGAYANNFFDGYLADIYFVDGQALSPSDFAEADATTGQWVPKEYSGSYGTNGFHLTFSDNSGTSSTTLGKDAAGSNDWTPNNFSVASGSGNDSLVDVPQNGDQTDTGSGNEVRGNYATLNPLFQPGTYSNGNLDLTTTAGNRHYRGTIGVSSGKWYWEVTPTGGATPGLVALVNASAPATENANQTGGFAYYSVTGNKQTSGVDTSYGATYTYNDVIGVAFDADNGTLTFYKNGTSQGTAFTGLTDGPYFPACSAGSTSNTTNFVFNAGQRAFAYSAPSGYKALCTTNLTDPTITDPSDYMDVALYTGNQSARSITGLNFSPDLVWIKKRSASGGHPVFDTVRGVTKYIQTHSTGAEGTDTNALTAFNSDGFSLGTGYTTVDVNQNTATYVAWTWDAGSSTASNTDGSITSSVRANQSAGFSIVSFNAGSSGNKTVGHGLNADLGMFILKDRDNAGSWQVWHKGLSNSAQSYLQFDTGASANDSRIWANTAPTNSVFSFEANYTVSNNVIGYCWAPVAGYSAFGSYTGNGSSDGPFVYTGFRPRWLMTRNYTNTTGVSWHIYDTARDTYNIFGANLKANSSNAEATIPFFDILSNGFKVRNSGQETNGSGQGILYAAFAESPFKFANAR